MQGRADSGAGSGQVYLWSLLTGTKWQCEPSSLEHARRVFGKIQHPNMIENELYLLQTLTP